LYREVHAVCVTRTTQEWLDFGNQAGIPVTRVATIADLVDGLPLGSHPLVGEFHLTVAADRCQRYDRHRTRTSADSRVFG
jgi:hypothetical protein